jgi:hypothetical protein
MKKQIARLMCVAIICSCIGPRVAAAQAPVGQIPGAEFTAGANPTAKNVKADGTMFIPDNTRRVRAVIVLVESWPGADRGLYDNTGRKIGVDDVSRPPELRDPRQNADQGDLAVGRFRDQAWRRLSETSECALLHLRLGTIRPEPSAGMDLKNGLVLRSGVSQRVVRNAGAGGADALLVMLRRLGEESAHEELKDVPLVLWGWSAPASFGTTFAELYPERLCRLSPVSRQPARIVPGYQGPATHTCAAHCRWHG